MASYPVSRSTDIVVVGSGPGGATVARQLARAGQKVMLLECGKDHRGKPYYGTYLGPLLYADRASLLFSKEGMNIIRPLMLGGATSMYCGSAGMPPPWLKERYRVDLDAHIEETVQELAIAPLAPAERGVASTRIAEAAQALGQEWEPQPKFMRPARSPAFRCGARCMMGCRCGAKWNAAEYVDDAVAAGCELLTGATVDEVIVEHGQVGGVRGKWRGMPMHVEAKTVVLSAGGMGTPLILQRSGFHDAGHGMAMDTTTIVCGIAKEKGIGDEPPMTWAWANDEIGYMLSTLLDPWGLYPIMAGMKGIRPLGTWAGWSRALGVMVKIKDEIAGGIALDGEVSKPITERDRYRLNHGAITGRQILVKAGADPDTIFVTPLRGTHPCSTVRLGEMLDQNLQTRVAGLYVCDASAFPEALDRPTVLTIIGFGKRLAAHLLASRSVEQTPAAEPLRQAG